MALGNSLASTILCFPYGWNVVATMRSPQRDTELKALNSLRILFLRLDMQDHASIKFAVATVLETFPLIDLLANNAGFSHNGFFEKLLGDQFDVNIFGVIDVTRTLLPHFQAHRGGCIINVSSGGAGIYELPMISIYCASKFVLERFNESLAFELLSLNIFVKSVIHHGGVK
ncbi:hypothetical protein C0991_004716 [Blastosporella zonata]|nr:hypothetical protein C0991_004716 [Blastosporella zonata]